MMAHRRRALVGLAVALGLVALAAVAVSAALDSFVNHHKEQYLAEVEARTGRKVTVGHLSISLLTGFGVTAEQVMVGGDPNTPSDAAPLLTVDRARVRIALLRGLFTLGRSVRIRELVLTRPTVNLVRFPDGTLNVERIAARRQRGAPGPATPMSARLRRAIENARVGEARIEQGRLRYTDLGRGVRPVEVNEIDLALDDVGIRARPSLRLRAAVMAPRPNLDLRAQFGEAGSMERLPPPLESVHLELARTEVGPLAPLLARALRGLEAGAVSADLDARLGALAPGGRGATAVHGGVQLRAVRFAGGAPFDATLDADLDGDAGRGDLDVRRLALVVGGASLVGRGRLQALATRPRFHDFTLESRDLDFDQLRRAWPQLGSLLGVELHGSAQLRASASGGTGAQRFAVEVDLTPASIALAGRFTKPRGMPLRVEVNGRTRPDGFDVQTLTLQLADLALHGGGTVRDLRQGRPAVDLRVQLDRLQVAALGAMLPSLAEARWPPITASASAHLRGRAGRPETMVVEIDRLAITSRKSDLAGAVVVRNFARPEIDLRARSSYLDTADLLPSASSAGGHQPRAKTATRPAPATASAPPSGKAPSLLALSNGHALIAVAHGIASGVPFDRLQAELSLRDGNLRATRLAADAFGGRVSVDGSALDLGAAHGPFHALGNVTNVHIDQAIQSFGGSSRLASGRMSAQFDTRGRLGTGAEMGRSLTGTLTGTVEEARLPGFSLAGSVAKLLAGALPFHLPATQAAGSTDLGTVHLSLRFEGGAVVLASPLVANTPEGRLELRGRVYFDGRLDLTGTLQLDPAAALTLMSNRVRLTQPLPLSLKLGGDVHHPVVGIANIAEVASVLVRSTVGGAVGGAAGEILRGLRIPGGGQENRDQPEKPPSRPGENPAQQLEKKLPEGLRDLFPH